jgi:hypothetical protein
MRAIQRVAAYSLVALIAALAATSASAHHFPKLPDYPFAGQLEKRERWQVDALEHARAHLRDLRGGPILLADGSHLSGDIRAASRWVRIVKRELGQTRAALAAVEIVAAESAPTLTAVYIGSGQWAIPSYIVMCESGGDYNAVNPSSGARGAYQIMPFHFESGVCVGLDWSSAGQDECARRIWNSAGAGAWACA